MLLKVDKKYFLLPTRHVNKVLFNCSLAKTTKVNYHAF